MTKHIFGIIESELLRRSAIETGIGHLKETAISAAAFSRAVVVTPPVVLSAVATIPASCSNVSELILSAKPLLTTD